MTLGFIGMLVQLMSICCICKYMNLQYWITKICYSCLAASSKLWERGLFFPPQSENRVSKEVRILLAYLAVVFLFADQYDYALLLLDTFS